jgi:excisionase family DNA binding protein
MTAQDLSVRKLFRHVRAAVDVLEEILLSNSPQSSSDNKAQPAKEESRTKDPDTSWRPEKLAYTLKEAQELVGISRSSIYIALADQRLRAVKSGKRTLVLATDLQAWLENLPAKS